MTLPRRLRTALALLTVLCGIPAAAQAQPFTVPAGLIAGMSRGGPADLNAQLHITVELEPRDRGLDALAATIADPASPAHRNLLSRDGFIARFGRPADAQALRKFFERRGATNVYVSRTNLVVAGVMTVAQAQRAFHTTFAQFSGGERSAIAPVAPLTLPVSAIRAVHGVTAATTPHLADVRTFTYFRGDWYTPERFRAAYDAAPDGGEGQRVTLIEDATDRSDAADLKLFTTEEPPEGASASNVIEHVYATKAPSTACGRDDRGQEPMLDVDAVLTLAPRATIDLQDDDVCAKGNDGTLQLQRALDAAELPSVVVFPFTVGNAVGPIARSYGSTPIALLEAAVLGIPVVVPAGDDGAYGMRLPGQTTAAVTYPCVSAFVICAGGTQVGDRNGTTGEAPWNDGLNAGGGGVSDEPRPSWQNAPSGFEFSPQFAAAAHRIVPDVSADASGHLRIFWHGYGSGGIGGTSESAALVGAQLATVNAAVASFARLSGPGDLYALARSAPQAFRDVTGENDRGYRTNTLHLPAKPLPLNYKGVLPSPAPLANGCIGLQQDGCQVRQGYDAVTGIGSLLERAAIAALPQPPVPRRQKEREGSNQNNGRPAR